MNKQLGFLVPTWSRFLKTGPKLNQHRIPKKIIFLIENSFPSDYKSYLSIRNCLHIKINTEQKVRFFGPVLVPFSQNGTKSEPPQNPEKLFFLIENSFPSDYKSYLSVRNCFHINSSTEQKIRFFGPVLVTFCQNGTKTEPSQNPEKLFFLIENSFPSDYKSYLSVRNRFHINPSTEQKFRFFGPVLVPFF